VIHYKKNGGNFSSRHNNPKRKIQMNIKKLTRKLYPDATRSNRKEIIEWFKAMSTALSTTSSLVLTNSPVYPEGVVLKKVAPNNFRIVASSFFS